jgi:hypothetical protein
MAHVRSRLFLAAVTAALFAFLTVTADQARAESRAGLHIELNRAEAAADGCRLSFVARNASPEDLSGASYEVVFFNKEALITEMTAFGFGHLPAGKTVVRQFDVPGLSCAETERLLVNGPAGCSGENAAAHCKANLTTSSRASIQFDQ